MLTGLSSTYLYRQPRESGPTDRPDDIQGVPQGHFVVIAGWQPPERAGFSSSIRTSRTATARRFSYWLGIDRVVAAILLGIVTHDANVLVIYKDAR